MKSPAVVRKSTYVGETKKWLEEVQEDTHISFRSELLNRNQGLEIKCCAGNISSKRRRKGSRTETIKEQRRTQVTLFVAGRGNLMTSLEGNPNCAAVIRILYVVQSSCMARCEP